MSWNNLGLNTLIKTAYGPKQLTPGAIVRDPKLFLAFGFGLGLVKVMPGTVGTFAALPIYWLLAPFPDWVYWLGVALSVIFGISLCGYASARLGDHDSGHIVWDEVIGMLLTWGFSAGSGRELVAGFILFRLLDILKPWPIRWFDRKITGGLGIVLDDAVAGLLAGACLYLGRYYGL